MEPCTPGTIRLFGDSGGYLSGNGAVVLIPPPTTDPTDPLRWTVNRKRIHLACLILYVYLSDVESHLQLYACKRRHDIGLEFALPSHGGDDPRHII
jgi:hypothetical protein